MDWKKTLLTALAFLLLAAPLHAGNRPEFDVVGWDHQNVFNDRINQMVVEQNLDGFQDIPINFNSFWRASLEKRLLDGGYEPAFGIPDNPDWGEKFVSSSGACFPDPCYGRLFGYKSVLTDTWNPGSYDWWIILQMKPESDIDLNIRDCVLKHNAAWLNHDFPCGPVFIAAEQTGRYRAANGQLMFIPTANPMITVKAWPGPYAQFSKPFLMDARTIPGLLVTSLAGALYTSKAIWDEGVVMVMPQTGCSNGMGEPVFFLKQGDQIRIHVEIPVGHPADIYYGPDNVSLKYIGICGTEFSTRVYTNCPRNFDGSPVTDCDSDQFQGCDVGM
jgi:hypothetical protein